MPRVDARNGDMPQGDHRAPAGEIGCHDPAGGSRRAAFQRPASAFLETANLFRQTSCLTVALIPGRPGTVVYQCADTITLLLDAEFVAEEV